MTSMKTTTALMPLDRLDAVHSVLLDLEAWARKHVAGPNHKNRRCKACRLLGKLDRLRGEVRR